jgi:hypothetical protein
MPSTSDVDVERGRFRGTLLGLAAGERGEDCAQRRRSGRPHERPIWWKGTKRTLPSLCIGYA